MSFADPDEMDEEPPANTDEADAETTETTPSPADTVELEWAAESEAVPDGELPLDEAIKANATVLRGKADDFAVERLQEEIDTLAAEIGELREDRNDLRAGVEELRAVVEQLRDDVGGFTDRLEALESWRGDTVSTVNQNIREINRLSAAVFDNGPPCPECEGGHLKTDTGGFGGDTVGCTDCEYEETLG